MLTSNRTIVFFVLWLSYNARCYRYLSNLVCGNYILFWIQHLFHQNWPSSFQDIVFKI